MIYVIAYDISNNTIRNRISKYLEAQGRRLQNSVFVCEATAKKMKTIQKKLEVLSNSTDTDIIVFPLCDGCQRKVIYLGKEKRIYSIF